MEDNNKETDVKNLLDTAKSIIIILPPDPGKDVIAAGISLHLSLKESGKSSQLGCGSEVHIDSQVEGVSEIADTIGSRNLIISFNYHEDDLEKVDYDVREDGKFYLMIKPKEGSPVPDIGGVKYSYSGADADLVITLGINSLEELGKIYADEKKFLDNAEILSLNTSLRPVAFSSNLFHKTTTSFSELTAMLIEKTGLKMNSQAANNLLKNIYESTNNLTTGHLTAETFSSISFLMRFGAQIPGLQNSTPKFSQPPFFDVPEPKQETILDENIPLPEEENLPSEEVDAPVPSDWNKPKIFRVGDKQDTNS